MNFDILKAGAAVRQHGFAVVEGLLHPDFVQKARDAMYRVRSAIDAEIGKDRLLRAGERGTLRLLVAYEPFFAQFLANPELLEWVDASVGSAAILHTQNGFILPSESSDEVPEIFSAHLPS